MTDRPHRLPRDRATQTPFGGPALFKRGASSFDLRDPYYLALSLSWPGFALAAITLEAFINIVFACLYVARPGCVANAAPHSFADAFFFSLETLATVGYGEMAPVTRYGHIVAAFEIVCGMAFTAIMTGLLFVRFSRPRARIVFSDQAVITHHNGRPTLMLRLGNGRLGLLTDTTARINVLVLEISKEGQRFRRMHELALARSALPMFPLTWTLMHEIDEASPLHGHDAESLAASELQMFVSVAARDPALGAEVQDMRTYLASAIAFGMRFIDVIATDDDGRTTADLTRISAMEPEF